MDDNQSLKIPNSSSISEKNTKVFKVLSIDGGGIKGLYSARILEHFEEHFNCCLSDYFDLICGTSTGGLIALGVSLGIPVSTISNLYCERGQRIFPQKNTLLSSLKQFFLQSKYDNKELTKALQEIFGDNTISNSKCLLCIPSFSLTDGRPYIFKYDHSEGQLKRDNRRRYIDIALATSAAPTYLPIVTDPTDHTQFTDGGVYANNPTFVGIMEALKYFVGDKDKQFKKLMVMSVSSLEDNPGRRFIPKHRRSIIDWKEDLISIFFEGQASQTKYFAETLAQLYGFNYVRIPSASLSSKQESVITMDNSSIESIQLISKMGNDQALLWEKKPEVAEFFQYCKQYIIR